MKTLLTTLTWLTVFICTLLCVQGCRVIWTDHMFAAGLFTDFKADNSSLISEPNYLEIIAGQVNSKTDDVRIITPSVIIETKGQK